MEPPGATAHLRRGIGLVDATALVVGSMIGSGIFARIAMLSLRERGATVASAPTTAELSMDEEPSSPSPLVPPPAAAPPGPSPANRPIVSPLAPERYRVQFTVSQETHDKLRRVQDLLCREVPDGDPAVIFDRALDLLLASVEKKKMAATAAPRRPRATKEGSRHIPANVRREVWKRDARQCAFVGRAGRCTQRRYLECHHIQPYGHQGPATLNNIALRCRAHNAYESELVFGPFDPGLVRGSNEKYAVSGQNTPVPERVSSINTRRRPAATSAG